MAFTIENNQPSAGCIRWSNLHMQYLGTNYTIADGYTNYIYAYWTPATPNNLVVSNSFPTLGVNDCLIFLNKNGVAVTVPNSTVLNGDLIVPGSIVANALAANTITGDKIAAGAITSTNIAADAITANAIATGAVTADSIAVNAVGANAIAAGAITTDKLVAGAVTAAKIAANTITANEIAANTITAAKLVAGTITAASGIIADATITNLKLADGAITNVKIADATIASGKIASLDAAKITSGTIDVARLSAGSITADKLDIRAKEFLNNFSKSNSLLGWTRNAGTATWVLEADTLRNSFKRLNVTGSGDSGFQTDLIEVDPTKSYKVAFSWMYNGTIGTHYFGGAMINVIPFVLSTRAFGSATSNPYFTSYGGKIGDGVSYRDMEAYIMGCNSTASDMPNGLNVTSFFKMYPQTKYIQIRFLHYGMGATSTTAYFSNPSVNEVGTGSINASQINAGTLVLGGASNGNGKFQLKDATSKIIGVFDKDGIVLTTSKFKVVDDVSVNPDNPWLISSTNYSEVKSSEIKTVYTASGATGDFVSRLLPGVLDVYSSGGVGANPFTFRIESPQSGDSAEFTRMSIMSGLTIWSDSYSKRVARFNGAGIFELHPFTSSDWGGLMQLKGTGSNPGTQLANYYGRFVLSDSLGNWGLEVNSSAYVYSHRPITIYPNNGGSTALRVEQGGDIYVTSQVSGAGTNIYNDTGSLNFSTAIGAYGFNNISDRDKKTEISDFSSEYALALVKGMTVYNYKYIDQWSETPELSVGIMADQAPAEIVDNTTKKNINLYSMLSIVLAALQKEIKLREGLEERLNGIAS